MARKKAKDNRQETVCNYIEENLVQFNRLRHDVISNKVQINDGMSRANALNDEMMNAGWRDITTSDINDIVCDCSQENEEQLLAVYFDIPAEGYGTFMTTAEISDKLVIKGSIKKPMSMVQLGMLLRKSGFQSKQVGPSRTRGWLVRERDAEEVNANRNIEGRTP